MSFLIALFIYAFSMAITPGPNNLIALSTGVNYGFKRAMPFTFGVVAGFNMLLATIGFGISTVAAESETFLEILGYAGIAFMCYMAYKIATAPTKINTGGENHAGFLHGFMFQWINPKAWTACLGGIGAFNLAGNFQGLIIYIVISFCVVLFSVTLWAYMGSNITRFLETEQNHRIFNYVMGASLFTVAIYVFLME